MQTNVKQTIAKCYDAGMAESNTVAYVLIHHCCGELPPFQAKKKVTEYITQYYQERDGKK